MNFKERAKNNLFENENIDNEINEEKMSSKYQLRKQKNKIKIEEQRKKRLLSFVQNQKNPKKKILLSNNDIMNMPLISNIKTNIKMLLEHLNSDDIEKNKWAIYSIRVYFEKENPELNEYLILFQNKIYQYLESLLKKYENNICIINEIFFIISNLFSDDDIVNDYPEDYFKFFLTDSYISIYQNILNANDSDLINAVFILLENILSEKNDLIKNIFNNEEFMYSILDIINQDIKPEINICTHFVKFFRLILNGIKNEDIKNKELFYSMLDKIFIIYVYYDKMSLDIINNILLFFIVSFKCKGKDEYENDNYITINYIFNERFNKNKFVHFFIYSLYTNTKFYLNNNNILIASIDLLQNITYNCAKGQMDEIFTNQQYNIFELLNNIFISKINGINQVSFVKKLLNLCNNIIDTELSLALKLIFTDFFSNLIIFFSINLNNKIVVNFFLDTFVRLIGYNDSIVAENLYKRGIINEGIFYNLLIKSNENNNLYNEEEILKMCKIISGYLQTVYVADKKNYLNKEEYLLYENFKQFLYSSDSISEEYKECLLHKDFMNI